MRSRFGLIGSLALASVFLNIGPPLVLPEPPRLTREQRRRQTRRLFRDGFRERRHASWPYCGKRHRERLARQIAAGQKKADNGVLFA